MSVLACDRIGCDNIMCNRIGYIDNNHYYLCNECFEELVHLGPQTDLGDFMVRLSARPTNLDTSRDYFETIFPLLDEE